MNAKEIADKIIDLALIDRDKGVTDKEIREAVANGGTGGIDSDIVHPVTMLKLVNLLEPLTQ